MKDEEGTNHETIDCPSCVDGSVPVEPYVDFTGLSVECSRCWDVKKVCPTCESNDVKEAK
jgi:hypothetical protein